MESREILARSCLSPPTGGRHPHPSAPSHHTYHRAVVQIPVRLRDPLAIAALSALVAARRVRAPLVVVNYRGAAAGISGSVVAVWRRDVDTTGELANWDVDTSGELVDWGVDTSGERQSGSLGRVDTSGERQ